MGLGGWAWVLWVVGMGWGELRGAKPSRGGEGQIFWIISCIILSYLPLGG